MEREYNLDFYQAIKELFENDAWVRGDNFASGLFLKLNSVGQPVLVNANDFYEEYPVSIYKGMVNQKYRLITVATKKELEE